LPELPAVISSTAISLIGQFKVDYAIIGASAIDEDGALWISIIANSRQPKPSSPMRAA
jgi:DeoR/GlpR family transcriptional regulator of sugar metabolism